MFFFMFNSPKSGMGATAVRISPTQLGNEHQTDKQTDRQTDGRTYIHYNHYITFIFKFDYITLHYIALHYITYIYIYVHVHIYIYMYMYIYIYICVRIYLYLFTVFVVISM